MKTLLLAFAVLALLPGCETLKITESKINWEFGVTPDGEVSIGISGAASAASDTPKEMEPNKERNVAPATSSEGAPSAPGTLESSLALTKEQARVLVIIDDTAQAYGLDPRALAAIGWIESRFRNIKNPRSTASGIMQFIASSADAYGLDDPFDIPANVDAGARMMKDNAAFLSRTLGRQPEPWMLYLAHQQGPGGALRLLTSPDRSAAEIVGQAAFSLNTRLGRNATAAEFVAEWRQGFDRAYARFTIR
ncbi:transglycosylase SLT domain-containing protein [Paenirhodobacter populi]|uniref:Lytic transglycosylase domain-containing protein n=1 Tax=Paenirhodobacter populi TaxID=2306993 RepID=A0A443IJJ1_9RHOB|nr:transglycosylase SLT domain-containing protein [Sinirhodobacter populi]RWR04686.1 lytic transglycosylase domain-containing protein [Sinirhodobacter populi]